MDTQGQIITLHNNANYSYYVPVPRLSRIPPRNSLVAKRSWFQMSNSRARSFSSWWVISSKTKVQFQTGFDVLRQMLVLCLFVFPFSGSSTLQKMGFNHFDIFNWIKITLLVSYPLHKASILPFGLAGISPLASLMMTCKAPFDFLVLFVGDDSLGMYLRATIMSPRNMGKTAGSSIISD